MADPTFRRTTLKWGTILPRSPLQSYRARVPDLFSNTALDLVGVRARYPDSGYRRRRGALSGPAAERGATVLATGRSLPGWSGGSRNSCVPFVDARLGDGRRGSHRSRRKLPMLHFTIFGVMLFLQTWRQSLREQARRARLQQRATLDLG